MYFQCFYTTMLAYLNSWPLFPSWWFVILNTRYRNLFLNPCTHENTFIVLWAVVYVLCPGTVIKQKNCHKVKTTEISPVSQKSEIKVSTGLRFPPRLRERFHSWPEAFWAPSLYSLPSPPYGLILFCVPLSELLVPLS